MKMKFLFLSILSLFAISFSAKAQVTTDLQLSIVAPIEGEEIPFGDTAKLIVNIKNLGPDNIKIHDTLTLKIVGASFGILVADTLLVGDSIDVHILSAWNTEEEEAPFEVCVYIDNTWSIVTDEFTANDTACVSAVFAGSGSTGLAQAKEQLACSIYPNPVSGLLHVTLPPDVSSYSYSITDYTGKTVKKENAATSTTVDLSSLPAGLYFINISTSKGSVTRKVSVLR